MWLDKAAHFVETSGERVSRVVSRVGAGFLAALMFLISADVTLRYVFNSPIPGALETSEFLLVIVLFFSIAYTAVQKGHVSVDLVTSRLSPRARAVLSMFVSLLSLVLFALIIWRTVMYSFLLKEEGAVSHILRMPLNTIVLIIAFGSALLCCVLLGNFLSSTAQALRKSRWYVWLWLIVGIAVAALIITVPSWGQQLPWRASPIMASFIGIAALFVLLATGMPVGFVMLIVGFLGIAYLKGIDGGFNILGLQPYRSLSFAFASSLSLYLWVSSPSTRG